MYIYAMSIDQVLELKIVHFWLLVSSIERLLADQEYRRVRASTAQNMKEADHTRYFNSLKETINGNGIISVDAERDDDSRLNILKSLSGKSIYSK